MAENQGQTGAGAGTPATPGEGGKPVQEAKGPGTGANTVQPQQAQQQPGPPQQFIVEGRPVQAGPQGNRVKAGAPVPLTHGAPDPKTAQPIEGAATVMTSAGELDAATVHGVRVGGTGIVHIHAAGPDIEKTQQAAEAQKAPRQEGLPISDEEAKRRASLETKPVGGQNQPK